MNEAKRDAVDELVRRLLARQELIRRLQPCTITIHLPPIDEPKPIRIEVTADLK